MCVAFPGGAQSEERYAPTIETGPVLYSEAGTLDALRRRLDAHEAEIRTLRATQSESREASRVPPTPSREGDGSGLTSVDEAFGNCVAKEQEDCSSGAEAFSVELGGRILFDGTWGTDDGLEQTLIGETFQNGHQFRRVRLFAEGTGYEVLEYKLQLEFSNGRDGPRLRDVYFGMKDTPFGNFRIGHQKEPNSLEKMTSSKYNVFMERGLPRPMLQVRGAGFLFFDTYSDEMGTWALGSFFDDFQQTATSIDGTLTTMIRSTAPSTRVSRGCSGMTSRPRAATSFILVGVSAGPTRKLAK